MGGDPLTRTGWGRVRSGRRRCRGADTSDRRRCGPPAGGGCPCGPRRGPGSGRRRPAHRPSRRSRPRSAGSRRRRSGARTDATAGWRLMLAAVVGPTRTTRRSSPTSISTEPTWGPPCSPTVISVASAPKRSISGTRSDSSTDRPTGPAYAAGRLAPLEPAPRHRRRVTAWSRWVESASGAVCAAGMRAPSVRLRRPSSRPATARSGSPEARAATCSTAAAPRSTPRPTSSWPPASSTSGVTTPARWRPRPPRCGPPAATGSSSGWA